MTTFAKAPSASHSSSSGWCSSTTTRVSRQRLCFLLVVSHGVLIYFAFQIGSYFGGLFYGRDEDDLYGAGPLCTGDGINENPQEEAAVPAPVSAAGPADRTSTADDAVAPERWEIPEEISGYFGAVSRIPLIDFLSEFDTGQPRSHTNDDDSDVWIFYDSIESAPASSHQQSRRSRAFLATENCNTMRVVTVKNPNTADPANKVCLAIQGNGDPHYHHVHKWMRTKSGQFQIESRYKPLPHHRQALSKTYYMDKPPKPVLTREAFAVLQEYLAVKASVVGDLEAMMERDSMNKKNFVVIMVCNQAHAEVLLNYVCSARAVQMPLEKVLLFATDRETYELGNDLGLTTYYNEQLFRQMPTAGGGAAAATEGSSSAKAKTDLSYMTWDYARFMMSKVWVCHLISELGLDFVFTDVDVFPYRPDAYEYLADEVANKKHPNFDLYFQDDHSDLPQYAPWSANSGLFYSRHNPRTRHFWSVLLRSGDLILRYKSHQATLTTLLSSMTSQYGLRVKVMTEESYNFPGTSTSHIALPSENG